MHKIIDQAFARGKMSDFARPGDLSSAGAEHEDVHTRCGYRTGRNVQVRRIRSH
jgi:hypothetical protein